MRSVSPDNALGNTHRSTQFSNPVFAAQATQNDTNFISAEYCLRVACWMSLTIFSDAERVSSFLSHLHSLVVTMSPKLSLIKSPHLDP